MNQRSIGRRGRSQFAGTGTLLRFNFRRDRFALVWWILGAVVLYWSQAVSIEGLYATQAEFDKAAAVMADNAAFIAMAGPPRVLNTIGGQVAWQASAFGAILAGLMSMFLIARHTRAEEESGRAELVRAGVVGRYAPVSAAATVVASANAVLGAAVAASLIGSGLPAAGSIALGMAATMAGVVFMSIALLAAQLTASTRTMYGVTGAAIAAAYVLRAVGDVSNEVWSWLSPIGWGQAMRAYAGETWWPVLLSVVAIAVCGIATVRILAHRDVGAGLWPARPGPVHAGPRLQGPFGLAWRLQRGAVIGWSAGLFLIGLAYGSIGSDVGSLIGGSSVAADVFAQTGGNLVDSFYATSAVTLSMIASGFTISSALRLRAEENAGRIEALLTTALPRWRWALSHLLVMAAGSTVVVAVAGFGTGLAYGVSVGDGSAVARLTGAALGQLPAVLILGAITFALFGVAPRVAGAGWGALVFCLVVMMFTPILRLPGWLQDASPFRHLPQLPVQAFAVLPWLLLIAVAALIMAAGFAALRRRDVHG